MELRPHDLLKIKGVQDLVSYSTLPEWVESSLQKAPFVVVRRALLEKELIPVGIRGEARNERFAAFLPYHKVLTRMTPEQLAEEKLWLGNTRIKSIAALNALSHANKIISSHCLTWGPGGSVGFELASGLPTASLTSDLDIIIRTFTPIPFETAKQILKEFKAIPVGVDIQVETPKGALSLIEYEQQKGHVLLKTATGPLLVNNHDIWKSY